MPTPADSLRIALVHDWLTGMRGGEKCLEVLCELYPSATIFTLLHIPGSVSPAIESHPIRTSFIQSLPFLKDRYRHYLPLFPAAIERFDLTGFNIIISSSHCVAKGVRTPPGVLHVCYCHTPMRYIWHLYGEYFGPGRSGLAARTVMAGLVGWLRRWDVRTAANPTHFIANSQNVRARIQALYHRDADVIYPPVNSAGVTASGSGTGYYLIVTAMVPYKRVDIAIDAFNQNGKRLIIVGSGPDLQALRRRAGATIEFRGWASDEELAALYAGCEALLFPGEEDFGIVPVEAMAHGKPVVAFAHGGALETVREAGPDATGVLFAEQSPAGLLRALETLKGRRFDPDKIHAFATEFDRSVYKRRMGEYIERRWAEFAANRPQT